MQVDHKANIIANQEGVSEGRPIPKVIRPKNLPKEIPVPNKPPVSISEAVRSELFKFTVVVNPGKEDPKKVKVRLIKE
jgi:hypothetical protein